MNYQHMTDIWSALAKVAYDNCKRIDWWPITLSHPPYLSLAVLPVEERTLAIPKIRQEAKKYASGSNFFTIGEQTVNALADSITNMAFDETLHRQYTAYKKFLDGHRAIQNG
jgi:hypothetical protein